MSEIRRIFFADSVSSTAVQLRRQPGAAINDAFPGLNIHKIDMITGAGAAANADTEFFAANCTRYEVIIRRLT